MWKSERVLSDYQVDLKTLRKQHLDESKKILKILDFYYRVLFDIDGIQSQTSQSEVGEDFLRKQKEALINKLIEDTSLPSVVVNALKNPHQAKAMGGGIERMLSQLNEMIDSQLKELLSDKRYIKMDLPNYSRLDFWTKLANFTSVSLTDSRINLISHDTWCDIFNGVFSRVKHSSPKSVNEFVMEKFDTKDYNDIIDKVLAGKNFDLKNNNKINGLPEDKRALIIQYKNNGPFMNASVLSDIYEVLNSLEKGEGIHPKRLLNVRRYLRVENGRAVFLDDNGYEKSGNAFPKYTLLDNGEMKIEFDWRYDDNLENIVLFNPHRLNNKPVIEECMIAPAPLCYNADGKLLTVNENYSNNFIYKYLSLFRNTHAHDAYSVYKNPDNNWYVCDGIDGSELQYSVQWLECLMNNLVGNLDQILYGENSENQGSSRFFDVKPNLGTLASNNQFTLALKPCSKDKMQPFRSRQDFAKYLKEHFYIDLVINDDISLNKAKTIISEIQDYMDEKYIKNFAEYKKHLEVYNYSLKKDGKYVPNAVKLLSDYENKLWEKLEKQVLVLLNQRLSGKYKLKNYEITPYPVRLNDKYYAGSDKSYIPNAINYFTDRAVQYGLFDESFGLEEQLMYIDQMNERSLDILKLSKVGKALPFNYEGMNVMVRAINESLNHLGGDKMEGDSVSLDLVTVDGMQLFKSEVSRFLGVYALYNALIETGYADAVANSDIIKWELDKKDEDNIAKLDMKHFNSYIEMKNGKVFPQIIKTNEDKKRVLQTLRNALAHGNIFVKEPLTRFKNDKDITLQFANSQYVNGENGGHMVEANLCSIMAFAMNPVFTTPTKHDPMSVVLREAHTSAVGKGTQSISEHTSNPRNGK